MDDYCWIHSTFHVRSEFQGNVGCILDTVLAGKDSVASAAADTPDTAFYQWVPFTLIFQVSASKVSYIQIIERQEAIESLAFPKNIFSISTEILQKCSKLYLFLGHHMKTPFIFGTFSRRGKV